MQRRSERSTRALNREAPSTAGLERSNASSPARETEVLRILYDELAHYEAMGWKAVGIAGVPLVESIHDGETLVALVEREVKE